MWLYDSSLYSRDENATKTFPSSELKQFYRCKLISRPSLPKKSAATEIMTICSSSYLFLAKYTETISSYLCAMRYFGGRKLIGKLVAIGGIVVD
jgi:hypothetical protein